MEHVDSTSGVSSGIQNQIEVLLGEVEAELVDVVPEDRRSELLDEMRSHLNAMLMARISDGLSEATAWKNTHDAFGAGRDIGREMAEEWVRKPRIEREGAPLSRRDKAVLIGRSLSRALILFPAIFLGMPWLSKYNLDGPFFVIVMCVCLCLGLRKNRLSKTPTPWTPTAIWGTALAVIHVAVTWVSLEFGATPGTRWIDRFYSVWNLVFFVGMVVVMLRYRREVNTRRPWRALPQYQQSPVAAEEEFRLSPSIGFAVGLTCLGLTACFAGSQYLGIWSVVGVVAIVVGLGVAIARWLR